MNKTTLAAIAHYGIAALALLDAGLAYLGVSIPGVTVDPSTAFEFALTWFAAGHVGRASK